MGTVRSIYLDQKDWLNLARAEHGHPKGAPYRDVLELLRNQTRSFEIVLPLSLAHYIETGHRAEPRSRQRLARTMMALSGFATMVPPSRLLPYQVDSAVSRFFRVDLDNGEAPTSFGVGINHALGRPLETSPPVARDDRMLYEAVALGGFPPEVDPVKACTPFSRGDGESYRDHEQSLSERVDRFQLRPRLGDVVYVTELVALLPYLNDSLTRAQLDFDAVLASGRME
jgi:hypothetical protein